jgi:WD40 repeat protein
LKIFVKKLKMTVARNEMPEITKFQIEREQYLNFEVLCVSWSEKYDVLALATSTGDVCLYRLSWQKWWQATICEKTDEVICSLAYSLGSKLLAVGTTAGLFAVY